MHPNKPRLGISTDLFFAKDNYLRGATHCRLAPFSPRKRHSQCCQHCCDNTSKHHDCSKKSTTTSQYFYRAKWVSFCPPPPSWVRLSAIEKKSKEPKIPCEIDTGSIVEINSQRPDRRKYNGQVGEVIAILDPEDIDCCILYVQIGKKQPCFLYKELEILTPVSVEAEAAPQAAEEEVQPCQ